MPGPVRYFYQSNEGAYGARNMGLDRAEGKYVAFYDSDDTWLPHHLPDCVAALDRCPEVDWVYGACRMVEFPSGRELAPTTFYVDGVPRPFLRLHARADGALRILDDARTTRCMILNGLYCGLQNSMIRRHVFGDRRFCTRYRNEAEDQLIVIRALAAGHRFAYLDNVHVIYQVHGDNSSGSALQASLDKRLQLIRAMIQGYEDLRGELPLSAAERLALARRLGQDWFWSLGYNLLWQSGNRQEGLAAFRRGLRIFPWDLRCWKTYILSWFRSCFA
jgi:glycosyltransferase involved in cell wall biosynthesis